MEQNIIIDIPCAHTHTQTHTHTNIEKTKAVVKANSNLLENSQWRYKLESAGMWLGLASGVLLGYFVSNHMQPPAPRYCGCFFRHKKESLIIIHVYQLYLYVESQACQRH